MTDGAAGWDAQREQQLVQSAQRGDAEALRALLTHYAEPLFGAVILPRVGSRAEAEELLRDTLARAAEKLDDFRFTRDAGIWPWLRRIAVNKLVDRARRRKAEARLLEGYGAEVQALPPRIELGAEARLIEEEEQRANAARLSRALASLNPRYRQVIELRVLEERSREESAAVLEVSVATLDVLLHRALTALRRVF